MAVNVVWNDSAGLLAQLGQRAGAGQLAIRGQERALEDERFRLSQEESQRQFDLGLDFRAREAAVNNDLQRQQLAGNYSLAQQRMAADAFGQQQNTAADLYARQMAYDNEGQQRQYDWNVDSVEALERSAQEQLADWQKRQLNPEGKRKLHELLSDFSAIQGQRGVGLREDAYAAVLGDWMQDFGRAGLDIFEEHQPTPDELWGQGTRTDTDGTVYGLDRNGTWRKLREAPPRQLTQEEIAANTYELPTGETMFINPLDGKPTLSTPPKAAKKEGPVNPNVPSSDFRSVYAAAISAARAKKAKDEATGQPPPPTDDEVLAEIREMREAEDQFSGGGERPIVTAPNGARAYVNPDGSVEPIQ